MIVDSSHSESEAGAVGTVSIKFFSLYLQALFIRICNFKSNRMSPKNLSFNWSRIFPNCKDGCLSCC